MQPADTGTYRVGRERRVGLPRLAVVPERRFLRFTLEAWTSVLLLPSSSELVQIVVVIRVVERQFSEFLRQPNDVVAQLDEHDVLLRRRNAPALRLSQAARDHDRDEAFITVARLLRNLLAHNAGVIDEVLLEAFA